VITFNLNTKIYSKEVILKTCYALIDRMYIYLDSAPAGGIAVALKGKEKLNNSRFEKLKGEFFNELLNVTLRENVSGRNKKIVEYIVGGAITASIRGVKTKPDKGRLQEKQHLKESKELEEAVESLRRELAEF